MEPAAPAAIDEIDALATRVLTALEDSAPRLGAARLLCIDGLAGSGKSSLAAALARRRPDATVLGTDEMLHGWRGLPELGAALERLLLPLAAGRPGSWRRWDWVRSRWAEEVVVAPTELVVLEGVGSASVQVAELISVLAWLEADAAVRRERWRRRDGEEMLAHAAAWFADEATHHRRHRTRERADLVFDTGPATGTGGGQASR